jgi:hypothetical protein
LVVGSFLVPVGCGLREPAAPPPQPFKGRVDVRTRGLGPVNVPQEGKVGGVDYAVIHYLMWDDRIALLIWIDNENQNFSGQGNWPRFEGEEAVYEGTLDQVAMKYRTADGKNGSLTIAGQELNLANGWLVLVSTAGGELRVKQLQRERLKVQPDIEGGNAKDFEKIQGDPDVIAFFTKKK